MAVSLPTSHLRASPRLLPLGRRMVLRVDGRGGRDARVLLRHVPGELREGAMTCGAGPGADALDDVLALRALGLRHAPRRRRAALRFLARRPFPVAWQGDLLQFPPHTRQLGS